MSLHFWSPIFSFHVLFWQVRGQTLQSDVQIYILCSVRNICVETDRSSSVIPVCRWLIRYSWSIYRKSSSCLLPSGFEQILLGRKLLTIRSESIGLPRDRCLERNHLQCKWWPVSSSSSFFPRPTFCKEQCPGHGTYLSWESRLFSAFISNPVNVSWINFLVSFIIFSSEAQFRRPSFILT